VIFGIFCSQDSNLPLHYASKYLANLEVICSLVQVNSAATSAGKAFKNELEEMCGRTFDKIDLDKEGVLQPENMVQLAVSIKVSLATLLIAEDQPIARATFVFACMRHIFDTAPDVLEAKKHALAGLTSLRCLGKAYELVQDQRSHGVGKIEAFESLVGVLKQHQATDYIAKDKMDTQTIDVTEQNASKQLEDLRMSQRKIQDEVATFVECLDKKVIQSFQSLDQLPEEVKHKIRNRDTMRSQHVREMRVMQADLLRMAIEPSKFLSPSKATKTISDVEAYVLGPMATREECLRLALDASRAAVEAYNTQSKLGVDSEHELMGVQVSAAVVPLPCYDEWVLKYLTDKPAQKTNAAMTDLKEALANDNDVARVLGFKHKETGLSVVFDFDKVFTSAGSAIAQEREYQLTDTMAFFPCLSILHAGRQLLEEWQTESAVIRRLVKVYRHIGEILVIHEKCLNDSMGELYQQKDRLVKEVWDARQAHTNTMIPLQSLTPVIEGGNENHIQALAKVFGILDVPTDELLRKLRRDIRLAHDKLTIATESLTAEIQNHFPEVILFIGQGLPFELGPLWRPAQSWASFEEHEQIATAGVDARHNVWRVRRDSNWFAIKEYAIQKADSLRTCLKEAAVVHRHKHHTIVEIVGLFQGDGGNTFYMQMPLYEHGSLDKWICKQLPEWPKVRSVLLDALIGLSHLHEHKIIHSDIKPANILVDSRERGRLSDFDISVDTKDRTTGAHFKATMRATQKFWTEDFAAPELKAEQKATQHTDVFAYGKTVNWVHLNGRCEPTATETDPHKTRGATVELVTALTSVEAKSRPSATDATQFVFFTILDRKLNLAQCGCCLADQIPIETGIECGCKLFLCTECLERQVKISMQDQQNGLEGKIMCTKYKCTYEDRDLARFLPASAFVEYLEYRTKLLKEQLAVENENIIKQTVSDELTRIEAMGARQRKSPVPFSSHSCLARLSNLSPTCSFSYTRALPLVVNHSLSLSTCIDSVSLSFCLPPSRDFRPLALVLSLSHTSPPCHSLFHFSYLSHLICLSSPLSLRSHFYIIYEIRET